MKLRPYQDTATDYAIKQLFDCGNSLIVAPTGAGKTIMMAGAIGKFYTTFCAKVKKKPHVLVLVHRTEIHDQNHEKFSQVVPQISTSEITATRKRFKGNVHFAMVQTFANVKDELPKGNCYDLIVIDEAHHSAASTYKGIIEWNKQRNPEACLLGVTATPNRGDKMPLVELFDNFYQITFDFLFNSHFLVRPQMMDKSPVFGIKRQSAKGDKVTTEKGKLDKNLRVNRKEMISGMVGGYLADKLPGKTVIFAPSHKFCLDIVAELQSRGRNPAYLSLGMDDVTRKETLERFQTGDSEELVNVDICTEGYDFPALRNLVEFDTNGSHTQWVQKVGRVLRTTEGKTTCLVIDFGGNIERYPDGVESTVNLQGEFKEPKGSMLRQEDFFADEPRRAPEIELKLQSDETYTPYHLPAGFESVNDKDHGIVFVACGEAVDALIVALREQWQVYLTDKKTLYKGIASDFATCIEYAQGAIGEAVEDDSPLTKMQVKLLAPEYPTATLTKSGADCCICWKCWKKKITEMR